MQSIELLRKQAGGGQRGRKKKSSSLSQPNNSSNNNNNNNNNYNNPSCSSSVSFISKLPQPLVDFDAIDCEQISLVRVEDIQDCNDFTVHSSSDNDDGNNTNCNEKEMDDDNHHLSEQLRSQLLLQQQLLLQRQQQISYSPGTVLAKIQNTNNINNIINNKNSTDDNNIAVYINPQQLHQTVDYRLWMTLRDKVDVSASQFGIILGSSTNNNSSTTTTTTTTTIHSSSRRQAYFEQKVYRTPTKNFTTTSSSLSTATTIATATTATSKACAWGIRMEPLALEQYQNVVAQESNFTTTVQSTGMHILTIPRNITTTSTTNNKNDQKVSTNINNYQSLPLFYTLGASPDGIVVEQTTTVIMKNNDNDSNPIQHPNNNNNKISQSTTTTTTTTTGLLEIKCLWGRRNNQKLPPYHHCPNRYFDQIQGQLAICDKPWCDLMLFIPPSSSSSSSSSSNHRFQTKRKKKKKKKKTTMNQQTPREGASSGLLPPQRPRHGPNYSIVRVYRNEIYWKETLLPSLLQFCHQVSQEQQRQQQQQQQQHQQKEDR